MKQSTLHRHLHPIHWHGSMIVAIAAILLTSVKSSGEMLRGLQGLPARADVMSAIFLRDAETTHLPVILNGSMRHAAVTGK